MKKIYIAIALFLLAFAVPVTVYSIVNGDFDIRNEASEDDGNNSAPQIVSIPVTSATVGDEYNYRVTAIDDDLSDVSTLEFIIDEKPSWLKWDDERNILSGTPNVYDIGTDSVSIKVSDGKWLGVQKFNIEIEDLEDEDSSSIDEEDTNIDNEQNDVSQTDDKDENDLEPIAEIPVENNDTSVLGVSDDAELPDTADMGVVVGISLGFAVLMLAAYLWLDSKYQFTDRFTKKVEFALGRQTSFQFDNGLTVKRKRSKL